MAKRKGNHLVSAMNCWELRHIDPSSRRRRAAGRAAEEEEGREELPWCECESDVR